MSLSDKLASLNELVSETNEKIIETVEDIISKQPEVSEYVNSLKRDEYFGFKLGLVNRLINSNYFKVRGNLKMIGLNNELTPWRELIGLSTERINKHIRKTTSSLNETIIKHKKKLLKPINQALNKLWGYHEQRSSHPSWQMPTPAELIQKASKNIPFWLKDAEFINSLKKIIKTSDLTSIEEPYKKVLSYLEYLKKTIPGLHHCPECFNYDNFHTGEGFIVCEACGLTLDEEIVSLEKRAYNNNEISERKRTEPRWRDFGPRTMIKGSRDGKGNKLNRVNKSLFKRLSKIQNSLISSIERNFWESEPKLKAYCNKLNLPDHVKDTARKIYRVVARKKLTMGRSINNFIGASIYTAVRFHKSPKLLKEIIEKNNLEERGVHQSLGIIMNEVLPELGITYKPITAERLVYRFGEDLNIPLEYQKKAHSIIEQATINGLKRVGKNPKGIAAAAIYLALRPTVYKKTQKEVSETAMITEVTLRSRVKNIKKANPARPF
ncbi:hypothetical protein GF352_04030 [archaeon]|nr:hypothetical protein [archaeon]